MTEAEWLAATDPEAMLRILGGRRNDRKLRLFAVACSRRTSHLWSIPECGPALEVAERLADGQAVNAQRRNALHSVARTPVYGNSVADTLAKHASEAAGRATDSAANAVANYGLQAGWSPERQVIRTERRKAEKLVQTGLLRDIFGNPFRPVTTDPDWRTSAVLALAGQMYDGREFSLMPVLADALQDAGCENPDILTHCRSDGPHIRGCWVIDLVLGKE